MNVTMSNTLPKKVGFFLSLGILFIPLVFTWFLLKQGYSRISRIVGFTWLGLTTLLIFFNDPGSSSRNPESIPVATTSPIVVSSAPIPLAESKANTPKESAPLLPSAHPRTFCNLAVDLGYPSRGYNPNTGGCASNMTDVTPTPGKNGLTNNLAFYSMGEGDSPAKLMRVSLILNVNNVHEKAKAYAELARVAGAISTKILGAEPQGLQNAIQQGASRKWMSGEWATEVKYSVWPTGLGHDIAVYFRPSGSK